ncbi:MAG: hypothetical protein HUU22_11860 [Phycisphaerae bacterium]|nr:hypothetical protein [Phycisphaerae bacterium]
MVHRHGVIYHQEYGWDATFEALVAVILGEFVKTFDEKHERCYTRDYDGAQGSKPAHYMLRWVNSRGEVGPWSATVTATIGA